MIIKNLFRLELITGDINDMSQYFGDVQKCFGTLISTKHVITIANCIYHEGGGLINRIKDILVSKVISIHAHKTSVHLLSRPFRNKTGILIRPSQKKRITKELYKNMRKSEELHRNPRSSEELHRTPRI